MAELKQCSKCHILKPNNESNFRKVKNGFRPDCRNCESEYRKTRKTAQKIINDKYREENSEAMKEARKSWRDNNKDHIKEYKAAWNKKKKEEQNDIEK